MKTFREAFLENAEVQFADNPVRLRLMRFVSNRKNIMDRIESVVDADLGDEGRDLVTGKRDWSQVNWLEVMKVIIMLLTAFGVL